MSTKVTGFNDEVKTPASGSHTGMLMAEASVSGVEATADKAKGAFDRLKSLSKPSDSALDFATGLITGNTDKDIDDFDF